MFQQPTAGSNFRAKDHVGHLLLIYPRELRGGIVTVNGTADAVSCDIVVLTDQAGPRLETQVLLFQKPLVNSLRGSIGKDPVLARLGRGTPNPGLEPDRAPYILNPFTEQDAAYATQWLTSVGNNPFHTAPVLQQPAPAAPVAPLPQAASFPVPAAVGAGVPAPVTAPMPQAPGVPAAPPQWAAPQAAAPVAPVAAPPQQYAPQPVPQAAPQYAPAPAPQAAPVPPQSELAAAMTALNMQQLPPAAPAVQ